MDNKTLSRVSGKQTLLTRRLDLSCGLIKKENEQKNTVQVSIENGARPDWNEARDKPRRTSAPAELPPIKDALITEGKDKNKGAHTFITRRKQ